MTLQVDNPDGGPDDPPSFDGFAVNAYRSLRPGTYLAHVEDTNRRVLLAVADAGSHILVELPGGDQ